MTRYPTHNGPVTQVRLAHPAHLPVYPKVQRYERHPMEGPPIVLLSGGSGARALSETLIRYTHSSSHILPMFDDGGSSRMLRQHFGMPPPGDLRNRLMTLSDPTRRGNPEVRDLFQVRLSAAGDPQALEAELRTYLDERHPLMDKIEPRYRRIIIRHLERFFQHRALSFDLRGGSVGNFIIAGAYLALGDLESVIFELSALAAVRGTVYPVCAGDYHLKAELTDGGVIIGQSSITSRPHAPIARLAIVEQTPAGWREVHPPLNPLAARAVQNSQLIAYTMGSFYTSLISNLLVAHIGRTIRETKRPKVFVANLARDVETPGMSVSDMLREIWHALRSSDPDAGQLTDYVQYALVGEHGNSDGGGRVPVDLDRIRALGVEPIVLPLEVSDGLHDPELVAAVLLSLC